RLRIPGQWKTTRSGVMASRTTPARRPGVASRRETPHSPAASTCCASSASGSIAGSLPCSRTRCTVSAASARPTSRSSTPTGTRPGSALVGWVPGGRPSLRRRSLAALAHRLELVPSGDDNVTRAVPKVYEALESGRPCRRWLLIFDDADHPDDIGPLRSAGGHL